MLLSRVAESVYWSGRYLERAEATARLVKVHTELFLDLPRSAGLGWGPLLAVTGSSALFADRYQLCEDADSGATGNGAGGAGGLGAAEEDVVAFMATDTDSHTSVLSSLTRARANLRLTQALLPPAAWEVLNELQHWAADTAGAAIDRRTRMGWLDHVIRQCQLLAGLMAGTMSHDDTYAFLEVGRFVERADMTTRVLDLQAGILVCDADHELAPYADVTWTSVLRSLAGQQAFRRSCGAVVSGPDALRFLLEDPQFPRSVEHCLIAISRALIELPRSDEPMSGCADVQRLLEGADVGRLTDAEALHDHVDLLQGALASLHDTLVSTYFRSGLQQAEADVLVTTG